MLRHSAILCGVLVAIGSSGTAWAIVVQPHTTDGAFTSPTEWTGGSVAKQGFTVEGQPNGAFLYVDQDINSLPNVLYLMYDWTSSPSGAIPSNSFFDVFFQIPVESEDYAVHITSGGVAGVFVKPTGTVSPTNPDGSLNLSGAPWSPADPNDLALANFQAAIGFGPSPDQGADHLLAEFQLTINRPETPGGPENGIYDPAPAFWSASSGGTFESGGGGGEATLTAFDDPPISSGIFTLNPDGTTLVAPVFGPDGGPVIQPQDAVSAPEPSTLAMMLMLAGMAPVGYLARRRGMRHNV